MRIFFICKLLSMNLTDFLQSESASEPHYLLIGSPIGHSVSPLMHNTALQFHNIPAVYHAVGVRGSEITSLYAHFNSPFFMGANVTIPYKETLFEGMDSYSSIAAEIGAVNTIVKEGSGIKGDNTDAFGFIKPIEKRLDDIEGSRVVIFGTGGATKAIVYALSEHGAEEITLVSRRPERYEPHNDRVIMSGYDEWMDYADDDCSMIVNATPLGMVPNTDASPVKEEFVDHLHGKICYDIVYNPRDTRFLDQAIEHGGYPVGGLDMLIWQAARSFSLWTGKEFPIAEVRSALDEIF